MGVIFFLTVFGLSANIMEFREFEKTLISLSDGGEGSDNEQMIFNVIAEKLEYWGVNYTRIPLNTNRIGHSYSEVIEAVIQGKISDFFILATPVQNGAFAISLLVEIAGKLVVHPPLHTVKLLFLGGEKGDTPWHPYGSRYFIESTGLKDTGFAIYIESETVPETWTFIIGGNRIVAPLGLTRTLTNVAMSKSLPFQLYSPDIHVNNLGFQINPGSYGVWLEGNLPAVALWGKGNAEEEDIVHQIDSTVSTLLELERHRNDIQSDQEHTYLYFHPLKNLSPHYIGELSFVLLILIYFALLLIFASFQYRKIKINRYLFATLWWSLPLLFLLLFFFLFLSTLLLELIGYIKDFPTIWKYSMPVSIFFKYFSAIALSLNFILVVHGLPLPVTPHFYSHSAIIISNLFTLILMIFDITLVPYTLWITTMLIFFTISRNLYWKLFFIVMSIIPHVATIVTILKHSYVNVIEFLLLNRFAGNFFAAFSIFPILLAVISIHYWASHYAGTRRNEAIPPLGLIISLSATVSLIWLATLQPFNSNYKQPVTIVDNIDSFQQERFLEIDSPAPLGNAVLYLNEIPYNADGLGRQAKIRMPYEDSSVTISSSSRKFLGRRTINVVLEGIESPHRLYMKLRSQEIFTLHSASMPFEMAPSGQEASIFIGDNPPFPFSLQITVNDDSELELLANIIWNAPENPPGIVRENVNVEVKRNVYLVSDI